MTTTRPPRFTMSCMRSLIRGAVKHTAVRDDGFAPIMTSRSVRSRSGIGTAIGEPYEQLAGDEAGC